MPDEVIHELTRQLNKTEARIQKLDATKHLVLAFAGPFLVATLLGLAFFFIYASSSPTDPFVTWFLSLLYGSRDAGEGSRPTYLILFRSWIIIVVPLVAIYLTLVEWPLYNLRLTLRNLKDKLRLARMRDSHERYLYLKDELDVLAITTPQLFFDNDLRYHSAKDLYEQASEILDKMMSDKLATAQSLISSIQIICLQVQRERRDQRNSRYFAIATIVVWVAAVILLFAYAYGFDDMLATQVFFWGAMGSLAMTLYHFFNRSKKTTMNFDDEFRWLIARPVFGIIMGAVAFLVYNTGMLILFRDALPGTEAEVIDFVDSPVTYIIVFLAAFSDRFYHGLFERLLDTTLGKEDEDKPDQGKPGGKKLSQDRENAGKDEDSSVRANRPNQAPATEANTL